METVKESKIITINSYPLYVDNIKGELKEYNDYLLMRRIWRNGKTILSIVIANYKGVEITTDGAIFKFNSGTDFIKLTSNEVLECVYEIK